MPYTQISQNKIHLLYTENYLCKLLCKPKDQVATEDKNNIVYEIDCSNSKAVYFSESKSYLKMSQKI